MDHKLYHLISYLSAPFVLNKNSIVTYKAVWGEFYEIDQIAI